MAGRQPSTTSEVMASLWLREEAPVRRHLEALEAEGLLAREGERWRRPESPRADLLLRMLSFALAYDIDYNPYLEAPLLEFLRRAYDLDYFTTADLPEESRGRETLGRLLENGLILAFRFGPLVGRMVKNPFPDLLCEYTGIRPQRRLFGKKIRLENVILEKQMALRAGNLEQVSHAAKLLHPPGAPDLDFRPTRVQRALKFDLVPEVDLQVQRHFAEGLARMRAEVKEHQPLSVDLIRTYHGILMRDTAFAGQVRTAAVHIRNNPHFKTAPPRQIEGLLKALVEEYRARRRKARGLPDMLRLAAWTYNQFLFIHPFEDGNSRTARVVLAHILRQGGAGFEEVPPSFDVRFLQVTKGYRRRDDGELVQLLMEILLHGLNREELAKARDL